MKEMKVGEIGVVVYSTTGKGVGMLGEIMEIKPELTPAGIYYYANIFGFPAPFNSGNLWGFAKDQIRPISDPDAEQSRERKRELVV